jgi:hypothetical protein
MRTRLDDVGSDDSYLTFFGRAVQRDQLALGAPDSNFSTAAEIAIGVMELIT